MKNFNTQIKQAAVQKQLAVRIDDVQDMCHGLAKEAGWWVKPREIGTLLCLVHSEISEAMEGARKDSMDDHLPYRKALEVELADAMIRIMDISGAYNLDLGGAIAEKLAYNTERNDHKLSARDKPGGKIF